MTKKQLNTLKLFALNYNIKSIAKKLNVSKSTIRSRLATLKDTFEFDNACGIRGSLKRVKYNLYHPESLEEQDL